MHDIQLNNLSTKNYCFEDPLILKFIFIRRTNNNGLNIVIQFSFFILVDFIYFLCMLYPLSLMKMVKRTLQEFDKKMLRTNTYSAKYSSFHYLGVDGAGLTISSSDNKNDMRCLYFNNNL